ncbi:holo-ACP synthase [Paraneptunicella aestuarii]|uniref:holo-ACP synthase n=1 Tax=Paraneptunicella aestuarii TaxID=2831148 RepID=UPI001E61737F|nr:holo-ACP synthase [Paraneptunicella aestuarii]UAA39597.1 holo-ACP synthase [Paraneptunicella aestuarii]
MAIVGIGTDIVEIARIEKQLVKSDRLAKRVLTPNELSVFENHGFPARFLAKRFAAKEAAVKAIGNGIGNGVSFQHVEIANRDNGQPYLLFSGEMQRLCEVRGVTHSHISISDEQHYAMATVILEAL